MKLRTLLCFALGPLVPPLAVSAFVVIADGNWQGAFGLLKLGLILCYSIAFLIALPAHLILSRLRLTGATAYALSGFVLGMLTPGIVEYSIYYIFGARDYFRPSFGISIWLGPFGLLGLFVALVFWMIAKPDDKPSS
jgi:hypothetical protein